MAKIAGWKKVKDNTKEVVYEHKEPFVSPSAPALKGFKTTYCRVSKVTAKTKISSVARQVSKNKWVYYDYTIEPPSGAAGWEYPPHSGGDRSTKQEALDEILKWMRKHPSGSAKARRS